ncbi:hypothetical protein NF865_01735 [Thermococcus aggregans]|uniref:Uncharacterized protein n=1 Tax=Thermococcus aggregans TaxID=110163 RepID=A0A9E7MXX5_THEAG|nr:hypothetical protein [Thermococcus aggregans]USS40966.1 hypothetical protein NF865_01735 [Thermococcus aggregans]
MTRVHLWYTLPTKDYLKDAVLSSLSDTMETYTESVEEGDEEDFNELLKGIISRAFEYNMIRYGLKIGDIELIAPAIGNLIDFLEDVALSILYARKGREGILDLSNLPLEVNPLRGMNLERSLFYTESLKLLFGTFDPIRTLFFHKGGDILEITSLDRRLKINIDAGEYADVLEKDILRAVRDVERILEMFSPLKLLRPRIQWIKAIIKYSHMG